MEYAKIIVKNNYEKRGDLVLRSYIRAIRKIHEGRLLDGDDACVYGIVNNGIFHELFTNKVINFDNYIYVTTDEIFDIMMLEEPRRALIEKIIRKVLFNENIDLRFEVSTMEELFIDRVVEMNAYENHLSRIHPYARLNGGDPNNDYDNFFRKIEEAKMIKILDNQKEDEFSGYEILDYAIQYVKK